jgi:hypothetical protein
MPNPKNLVDQHVSGIYNKFSVTRNDGRDLNGGDRANAKYFVLDLTYDPYAKDAIAAYAASCIKKYPALAAELIKLTTGIETPVKQVDWRGLVMSRLLVKFPGQSVIQDVWLHDVSPSDEYLKFKSAGNETTTIPFEVWFNKNDVKLLEVIYKRTF